MQLPSFLSLDKLVRVLASVIAIFHEQKNGRPILKSLASPKYTQVPRTIAAINDVAVLGTYISKLNPLWVDWVNQRTSIETTFSRRMKGMC